MRLGVLDIGSNTGHLLVVDAHGGAAPLPAFSHKQPLRLAEHLDEAGAVTEAGIEALTELLSRGASSVAEDKGCEDMLGFATSAVRDAVNSDDVLAHVNDATGVDLVGAVGRGRGAADLPRRTPLVRLVGRPAGGLRHRRRVAGDRRRRRRGARRRLVDAAGRRPAGARATSAAPAPTTRRSAQLRKQIRADIARDAGHLLRPGAPDRAAATSKTFRSLARICGAAPSGDGPLVPRGARARHDSRSGSPS